MALIVAMIGLGVAVSSAQSSLRSATAAEQASEEAKRANDLSERPDVSLEVVQAADIYYALGIAFRSDTALDSLRITKTHTVINGQAITSGEWRPTFTAQHAAHAQEEHNGAITFKGVQVNQPIYVTWMPWHGHIGKEFHLRLDFDLLCVAGDRQWSLARSIVYDRQPPTQY